MNNLLGTKICILKLVCSIFVFCLIASFEQKGLQVLKYFMPDQTSDKTLKYTKNTKLYNVPFNSKEFYLLNENQIFTSRQTHFITRKSNNLKVGLNCLSNRLYVLNNMIPLTWLNDSLSSYKFKCKKTDACVKV